MDLVRPTDPPRLPTLSAVVPTNRPLARIQPTLDALLGDEAVIEVILSVDGPGAATLGRELDALDASSPRLRVLRLPRHVGAEMARRIAAEAALGEVVWFVDDDVVPAPGGGIGHARAHAETAADIVIGPLATPDGPDAGVPARLYQESFRDEWARFCKDPSSILRRFWAGNHSVRRTALLPLDVIPDVFAHDYHADRAFGLTCARAGLTAVARSELRASHNYRPALARWRRDCRRQGAGRGEIHRAFADLLGPDVADPWRVGLGRRGRLALRLARTSSPAATAVAAALAAATRLATMWRRHGLAMQCGRVLRSVEQYRGAEAAKRRARVAAVPEQGAPVPAPVSLLVISRGPSAPLRRILELWRPHVAEIVVVADRTGEPALLDHVSDLADRTAWVESAFPVESVLARCWPLCRQPFVLRGDDDEVPSTVLLAELRSLTLDATLQQAGLPMRWLWPDRRTWIDGYPWTANPQPKLVRNHAGLVRFPGRVHSAEHLNAPIRAVPLPVYHLRTLDPIALRRQRVRDYAGIGLGARHFDGRVANSQYLPEDAGSLRLAPVPPWDAGAIESTLETLDAVASDPATVAPEPAARPAPIAIGAQARLTPGAHRASVRVQAMHPPVASGGRPVVEVVIANRSAEVLPGGNHGDSAVSLSTRWRPAGGVADDAPVVDGPRLPLGEPIPPGRSILKVLALDAPVRPGRWSVTVDLVEESVAWFGDGDTCQIDLPDFARARASRALASPDLFQSILIETHNTCTRTCWFCKFGQERRDPEALQMDWDTIHRILANLRDLRYRGRISWYNINEPLADPRIVEIVEVTRRYCPDAFLSLVTNGDLLTAERYGQLKAAGLDALGVSVYDDATLGRVESLVDDRLVLLDMRQAKPGRLDNRGGNIRRGERAFAGQRSAYADAPCERPSMMLVVNPAGEVVLCCADMYSDVVMGDVRRQRLEEIWHGERFAEYRRTLAESGRKDLTLCSSCSYTGEGVHPFFPLPGVVTNPRDAVPTRDTYTAPAGPAGCRPSSTESA